jgi:glycerate 2-kinase
VLDTIGFDERLLRARAVITGEGRLDRQTLQGKLPVVLASRCGTAGVPLHAVVGSCELNDAQSAQLGLASIHVASEIHELEAAGRALSSSPSQGKQS